MHQCMCEAGYQIVRNINEALFVIFMPEKKIMGSIDRIIYKMLIKLVLLERRLLTALY